MARGRQAKSFLDTQVSFTHARNRFQLPDGTQLLEGPLGDVCVIRPNLTGGGFEVVMGPMACSTLCDILDGACQLARIAGVSFGVPSAG